MMSDLNPKQGNFMLYTTPEGEVKLNVFLENETIWLTQKSMSILFDTKPQNITIHLKNVFESAELEEEATCKEFLQVQIEGGREVSRKQKMYNLDAIISVGYRVNSAKATQFRIWATKALKEYIIKGFVLDDNRLKQGEAVFSNKFLNFNEFKILDGKGKISHSKAISKAGEEYDQFNKTQRIISDFDKEIKKLKK